MLDIPGQHRPGHEHEDLRLLLALCAERAREQNHPQLLSITLRVRHIDPLAVLQSAHNPADWHAYFEHPAGDLAVAAIDALDAATFSGGSRFLRARDHARQLLAHAIHAGDIDAPFAGPHFFCGFTFEDETAGGEFSPAGVFLPRWQVARCEGAYTAVANVLIAPDSDLNAIAERILAAHQRYRHFEYGGAEEKTGCAAKETASPPVLRETGGGWYADGVRQALDVITRGECQKVVLARTFQATREQPFSFARTLEALRERFPSCHTFSFANGGPAVFLGATPERLACLRGGNLQTEALAGTAARGRHAGDDARLGAGLIDSDKDQREHALVARTILDRLQSIGINAQAENTPRLVALSNVQHLRTPIVAAVPEEIHLLDVAAALHPTPAVGGVPSAAARAAIARIEPAPRGLYAGCLGWFDAAGQGRFLVGLRSALLRENRAELFAGAGIVAGSSPEEELRETAAKLRAMHESLR